MPEWRKIFEVEGALPLLDETAALGLEWLSEALVIGEFLQSRGDGRLVKSATMPVPPI
jgi:hypothetical protein